MYQPSQSAMQSSQRSTDLAAKAVREVLAWFPDQTPTVEWTDAAIRILQNYPPDVLSRLPSVVLSANPKRIPPVPQLKAWADAVPMPTKSGRSLPPPEELSRLTADYTAKWIRNNRDLIERLAAHGYPLVWRQEVTDAAFLAAQGGPAVAVSTADVDKWLDWPACPPKPLPSSILVGGRVIPL
jgi:hypothetical protein